MPVVERLTVAGHRTEARPSIVPPRLLGDAGNAGEHLLLRSRPVLGLSAMHVRVLVPENELCQFLCEVMEASRDERLGCLREDAAEAVESVPGTTSATQTAWTR